MSANGQLVFTDVDKVTFKGVGNTSNAVIDTLTGKIGVGIDSPSANLHVVGNCYVSTNFELGGTMTMGTVTVEAQHELSAITATGNVTPHTIQFTNPETAFTTTGNVEVGKELTVTGNVAVDTDTLFVDTVNDRVGVGTTSPTTALDVVGTVTATAFAGNASTATKLAASVNIGGVAFDGSAAIVPTTFTTATFSGDVTVDSTTFHVDSTNNRVGVGTTSPDAALHVQTTGSGATGGTVILNPNLNSSSVGLFLGKAVGAGTCMFMNYTHSGTDDSVDNTANFGIFSKSTNLTLKGNGNVGIGTTNPANTMHIYKASNDQTTGLFIEKATGASGSASLFFGVTANAGETNNVGIPKAGILFQRTAGNGRGDLKFCVDYVDDTNAVGVADAKMTITGSNGNVGIGIASSIGNLSLGSATVVKSWNAFNNNSSAGNYTFPRNCVALVHFHFSGGQDLNISGVYRITVPYAGSPTIEVLYSGSYVNATAGHGNHIVRFFGQNLPAPYNSASYQLRISQISYSGDY